jgi:hypothetical protein
MGAIAGVPQPFPYQGSKRLLAGHVLSWLPHKFDRLVEPRLLVPRPSLWQLPRPGVPASFGFLTPMNR